MSTAERYARWLHVRYGRTGRAKPVWAWLTECALLGARPRREQRRMFLGDPPRTLTTGPRCLP